MHAAKSVGVVPATVIQFPFVKMLGLLLLCLLTSEANGHHTKDKEKNYGELEYIPGKEVLQKNLITYYMYNITNPDEFEEGAKPMLDEVGPYVYQETRRKFNIEQVSDSVVKYTVDRYWEFMPHLSEGHEESDEFNVINIPMVILGSKLASKGLPKPFNDILIEELTEKGDSLVRRNEEVGNIIYYGMNVSVYTEMLDDVLQGNVPPEFLDGKFALFKNQNGSKEGTYTVKTKGPQAGDILSYNNKTKLDYWGGDPCNRIYGSDGYFFRPGVSHQSTLNIFYPELCRSVYLKWRETKKYDGITTEKFTFPEDMLEDPHVKEENVCFCSKPIKATNNSLESCLKRGFIDYASCKQESPLLLSYPHFLYADAEYKEKIEGLNPIPAKHETEFLIEPKTGSIVAAVRRFQFNVKLRPLENVGFFVNTSFTIFPVFNTERRMMVPQDDIDHLKEDLKRLVAKDEKNYYHQDNEPDHNHAEHHQEQDSIDSNKLSSQREGKATTAGSTTASNNEAFLYQKNQIRLESQKSTTGNSADCVLDSRMPILISFLLLTSKKYFLSTL